MGGVFNHINGNLYHYAGNNPVKYTDPDGRWEKDVHYKDTKDWALEVFRDEKIANAIAKADNNTDHKLSIGPINLKKNQGHHFNINSSGIDSRKEISEQKLESAIALKKEAESIRNTKTGNKFKDFFIERKAVRKEKESYTLLGEGLHALQDIFAHTDENSC